MKIIFSFMLLSGVLGNSIAPSELNAKSEMSEGLKEGEILTATVNEYADKIMMNLDKLIIEFGLDPLPLPDVEEKISKKILLITYWGSLKLTDIKLREISTVQRKGDAVITYDISTKRLTMDIPLVFTEIGFDCHYAVKIMGLGPTGRLDGKMKNVQMTTSIIFDYNNYQAGVGGYEITHSGHVTVHIHEIILVNWLLDLVANTITTIFKGLILDTIDDVVGNILGNCVTVINNVVAEITQYFDGNTTVSSFMQTMNNFSVQEKISWNRTDTLN